MEYDPEVVLDAVQNGQLSVDQACALYALDKEAALWFLGDRLRPILEKAETTKDVARTALSGVPVLDVIWKLFGSGQCLVMLGGYDLRVAEDFIYWKLHTRLGDFEGQDLICLEERYREKPLAKEIRAARAKRLVPIADQLLNNPAEINRDLIAVKRRVSEYRFPKELNEVLEKVQAGLGSRADQFDQAAMLKHLRTFFEKLHAEVAQTLHARKPETEGGTDLSRCQQVIDHLSQKGVLTDKMRLLARALYGVLSEEGVHAMKSEAEYVRFCRNWVAEYALVLFFELERRLKA
jgi:hypothetical protein